MTTGAKINHAKDNAANYSIATNMTTKMNAYMVAQDNVSIGMEMVGTAESIISQMQDHATRLRELSIQASNGTYGAQSLNAIQSEANARIAEITRLYLSSEYNGISLFDRQASVIPDNLVKAGASGFIDESVTITPVVAKDEYDGFIVDPKTYDDVTVNAMTSINSFTSGATGTFKIESAEDLAYLATITNDSSINTSNATFVLANDIDLAQWQAINGDWIPIGSDNPNTRFDGIFDGNGHKIKNLKTYDPYSAGLFGAIEYGSVKNLGVVNADVSGDRSAGAIAGYCYGTTIANSYVTGAVTGTGDKVGGLVGEFYSSSSSSITNSYATGAVTGANKVGGLVGEFYSSSSITNSYATGAVTGANNVGGLVGYYDSSSSSITNSYATGSVSGTGNYVGGLVGYSSYSYSSITNSYATGSVSGTGNYVGGLVGYSPSSITNSYATGSVSGTGNNVGGLVGYSTSSITNSYATGGVSGNEFVGGLVGQVYKTSGTATISSSYALGDVTGSAKSGSLIGGVVNTSNGTSFATINISDCYTLDSGMDLIGGCYSSQTGNPENTNGYDAMLAGISLVPKIDVHTSLQVGIMGDENSQISFNTNFKYDLSALEADISSANALNAIDDFISTLSAKEVELGSITNRLESVLDEIEIQYSNLASSRSTIKDADMAELSSTYIQQQILQQAAATLMSTANQSPAIALQLI